MSRSVAVSVFFSALLVVSGCRSAPEGTTTETPSPEATALTDTTTVPGTATIHGEVFYVQRIALPPDAEVDVVLQEVSHADAPAVEIASTRIKTEGRQVPFPFALSYEPAKIEPDRTYALSARISSAGQLLWVNEAQAPVLTRGAPADSIRIRLRQVPGN
jgi:putative lipoprotein